MVGEVVLVLQPCAFHVGGPVPGPLRVARSPSSVGLFRPSPQRVEVAEFRGALRVASSHAGKGRRSIDTRD